MNPIPIAHGRDEGFFIDDTSAWSKYLIQIADSKLITFDEQDQYTSLEEAKEQFLQMSKIREQQHLELYE